MATIDIARYPEFANCSAVELAYAAGFFDGEGHISICYQKCKDRFILGVEANQATGDIIHWFKEKFGGRERYKEFTQSYSKTTLGRKWIWQCNATRAALFLMCIKPYLIVKAEQADVAIAFQATMNDPSAARMTTLEMKAVRQAYHDQIRQIRKDAR